MTQGSQEQLFAGKFRLLRLLGKGAMGEVWLADEVGPRNFKRQVAVKRLLATEGISEYARESFIAEAQVIARLDHPNIVRLIELGESDERGLYLVLDYIDGAALDRIIRKGGALSAAATALIGREVGRALDAVHSMSDEHGNNLGVVHRDVSPANILVGRDGRVRLSDFGVARITGLGGEKTETGVFKGKLPYMPPEQALGEPFDGRADVFSLGITVFEALIGGRLRKAETQGQLIAKIATERVQRVEEIAPGTIPSLAHVINASTEFATAQRTSGASQFASQMQQVLFSLGPSAEEAAMKELAQRVADAAGGAPTQPRGAWSMAVSGENPSAHYALGPTSPSTSPTTGSGAFGSTGPFQRKPLSVPPPDANQTSVTRVATFADAQPSAPGSKTWVFSLAAAALLGIAGGSAWVLMSGGFAPVSSAPSAARAEEPSQSSSPEVTVASSDTVEPTAAPSGEPVATESSAKPSATGGGPKTRPGPRPTATATAVDTAATEPTGPGTLQVNVLPWGNVSVDGKSYGATPIGPISLPPGPHTVIVTNPDLGASRSATVKVVSGKQAGVMFDLKKSL